MTTFDGGEPRPRRLGQVPYARRYLAGQCLSILGDTALWLALGIWVQELTGSSAQAGLTFFFMAVASIGGPLWGTVADRFRRRRVLLVGNLATGAATVALLGVRGPGQVWLIWTVVSVYGISNSLLGAAQTGFLRTLLPDEMLGEAQGALQTARQGMRLVSPLLGAGLFAVAGGHVVALIDAATFAVAALSVATIRVGEARPVRLPERFRSEVAAGFGHIRATVAVRQMVVAMMACCAVVGFLETALFALVTVGLHLKATWLGPMECCMGVGALVGGPTAARAMRHHGEGRVAALGMAVFALGVAVLTVPVAAVDAVGTALAGFGLPWLLAASSTLVQRRTPDRLQGRVEATVDVLVGTPQSLSIAAGAALLAVVGYQVLLVVVAVVSLASALWLLTRTEQRPAPRSGPRPVGSAGEPALAAGPGGPAPGTVQG